MRHETRRRDLIGRAPDLNRRTVTILVILIGLIALWPAVVNGGPFYMPDTPSYFRGAASALFKLLHVKTQWTAEFLRLYEGDAASVPSPAHAAAATAVGEDPVTLSGRSIYYGMLLYAGYLAGSVWIIAAIQSLLSAASIVLTIRLISRLARSEVRPAMILLIGALTALVTSLGYFSGYLMPDLFTGLAALAVANLLALWHWLSRSGKLFWNGVLSYALLVHSTNLMLCTAIAVLWALSAPFRRRTFEFTPLFAVAACIAVGVLGQVAFGQGVKVMTGHPPVRPPFVAMRLIADGPGYAYLQDHCSTEHFLYCRALNNPRQPSDTLLWSPDPKVSLFRGLAPEEQRISAADQKRFVAAVVLDRPLAVIVRAARNSVVQLLSFDLTSFNYSNLHRERFEKTIPPSSLSAMKRTRAYNDTMPTGFVEMAAPLLASGSLLFLVFFLVRERGPLRAYCLCIVAAVLLNAAICGALSGPKGRYQMRLVWILPVVAAALASSAFAAPAASPRLGRSGEETARPQKGHY